MIRAMLAPFAPWLLGGVAAAALFGGVQTWRIGNLKHDVDKANGRAEAWKGVAANIQGLREGEAKAATASYEGLQSTCSTAFADAVSKGRTIERIIQTPRPAGGGRRIVTADQLRELVGETP